MAVAPNTGMSKQDMKRLLMRSKEEPVKCAIGLGDAGGLMVLHKTKQPRALESELKSDFPDARNTRFGSAFVDVDDNPKLVKLTLNKPVTGIAKRLIKTLKGTGFTKVMILTEDGSLMEQFEEADPEAEAAEAAASAAPAPAAATSAPAAPPPPAVEPEAAVQGPSAAELSARLATMAARIPAASAGDAARQEQRAKLARQGNVEIKTNNLRYAANTLAQLETALGAPPPPAPPPPAPGATPADTAARAAALSKELAELVPGIAAASAGNPARQAELAKLARDANVQIKTGNLTYAANAVEQLRKALAAAPAAPPPPAPPPPGATPQQKTDDAAALSKQLAALIPGIAAAAGGDAARQATLAKLAKDANVEIKTGNLAYATNTIARLRAAMEDGGPAASASNGAIPASRVSWTNMRQQIAADVEKLSSALAQTYAGQSFASEVEQRFRAKVAPMLARFDDRLGSALDDLADAAPDQRDALRATARSQVEQYRSFAESDAFIGDLDSNPFVPLQIRASAAAALGQVEQALS